VEVWSESGNKKGYLLSMLKEFVIPIRPRIAGTPCQHATNSASMVEIG
jgi:hypothetical protein